MNEIDRLHESAMEACDLAMEAKSRGDAPRALQMKRQAFERECAAAALVSSNIAMEPTRSILHRSAAVLAMECSDFGEAERLVEVALLGNPPGRTAEELQALKGELDSRRPIAIPDHSRLPHVVGWSSSHPVVSVGVIVVAGTACVVTGGFAGAFLAGGSAVGGLVGAVAGGFAGAGISRLVRLA